VKYFLIWTALLLLFVSCEETTRPEELPAGRFVVDSLYATFFVDKDMIGRIRTNLDIGYTYHFEKSAGYVKCNEVHSIIHDYDPRLCSADPMLRNEDYVYEYAFGVWAYCDYSYLDKTEIRLTIEGRFKECPYCDSGCDKCEFVWSEESMVEVENRLGD